MPVNMNVSSANCAAVAFERPGRESTRRTQPVGGFAVGCSGVGTGGSGTADAIDPLNAINARVVTKPIIIEFLRG
jgi:hypothetical protein